MLVKLSNEPMEYAWGSTTLISDYFGVPHTGRPMAEVWFGTHDGSPTQVLGSDISLHDLLLSQGKPSRLPYLLKILAAEKPLSIQAHPNVVQAIEGFQRENLAGIALNDPARNYKDDKPKPELIVALSPNFDALVGFADQRVISETFAELLEVSDSPKLKLILAGWIEKLGEASGIRSVFLETLNSGELDEELISQVVDAAKQCPSLVDLVTYLLANHGLDRGLISALMLNHIQLTKGQGMFVPAGVPHAYLSGLGVEVMVASDNVLRGGLTPKHIDAEELANILVFESSSPAPTGTQKVAVGLVRFDIPISEFTFYKAEVGPQNLLIDINLPGEAIVLCTAGEIAVSNSLGERESIRGGQAVYLSSDARVFSLTGSGEAYLAISAV